MANHSRSKIRDTLCILVDFNGRAMYNSQFDEYTQFIGSHLYDNFYSLMVSLENDLYDGFRKEQTR
jgi:hypothetical protein